MSRASADRWREAVAHALRDGVVDAVPGILVAMALDGYGHEAESLRRELLAATEIAGA